jgi:hypothetical protein
VEVASGKTPSGVVSPDFTAPSAGLQHCFARPV